MADIVVDANVIAHAANPGAPLFAAAQDFLTRLLDSDVALCLDEGYHEHPTSNTSKIWGEYLRHGASETPAGYLIAAIIANRSRSLSPRVPAPVWAGIKNCIAADPSDRVYATVAFNSESRHLISHDRPAFTPDCRERLLKDYAINVCAATCAPRHP